MPKVNLELSNMLKIVMVKANRLIKMAELLRVHSHSRMVLSTRVNGSMVCVMASVLNYGPMVLDMKDSGETIKQMVRENLFMLMVTYMKENGLTIKLKAKVLTAMPTVRIMRGLGLMINNTGMVLKAGLMVLATKVNILKERKRVMVA